MTLTSSTTRAIASSKRAGAGYDRVSTFVSFSLPRDVEELTLAATAGAINGSGHVLDETINGNDFNNTLNGDAGDDWLYGNGGIDTLLGTDGDDHLYGGRQNDDLSGGRDNDTLDGGAGDDTMNGGSGDDIYYVDFERRHGDGLVRLRRGVFLDHLHAADRRREPRVAGLRGTDQRDRERRAKRDRGQRTRTTG